MSVNIARASPAAGGLAESGLTLSGELPSSSAVRAPAAAGPATVVEVGLAGGVPIEVMSEYLAALGLGVDTGPDLLLDFLPGDLQDARRSKRLSAAPPSPWAPAARSVPIPTDGR